MSCQPHRVTPGQSNSGHKQIHISKLFSHICQPSVKSIYKTNHFTNMKDTYIHKQQTQIFEEPVPSILPLLKEHTRLGHAGIVDHPVHLIDTTLKKNLKKGMDRHNIKLRHSSRRLNKGLLIAIARTGMSTSAIVPDLLYIGCSRIPFL